jgi:hypothetical protein
LTSIGTVSWQKAFGGVGGDNHDWPSAILECSDGSFIIAGNTNNAFGWILKLSSSGNISWQKSYSNFNSSRASGFYDVQEGLDGSLIVAGGTYVPYVGNFTPEVLKLTSTGAILWQKAYGGVTSASMAYSIQKCSDDGFIWTGPTNTSGAGGYDILAVKITFTGAITWQKTYGGSADEYYLAPIQECTDRGFIIGTNTQSFGAGSNDVWIFKTSPDGSCPPVSADASVTVSDTTCTVSDLSFTVTGTTITGVDTNCTVTDTNCTVNQQAP